MAATYDLIADLPLTIEQWDTEDRQRAVGDGAFTRRTTTIRLRGRGEVGLGEDVAWMPEDHDELQQTGPQRIDLAGEHTLRSLARRLDGVDLYFGATPGIAAHHDYRRWAFESAALDLALRQAGEPLHAVLGRTPKPMRFVVSMGLGEPASLTPLTRKLDPYPSLRFKLDADDSWTAELIDALRASGAVAQVDLKGHYGEVAGLGASHDPALYERIARGLPEVWLEDPWIDETTLPVLEPERDRLTWDAPIHSVADVEALRFQPRTINVKPSRSGPLERLFALYDHLSERDIGIYGGGQYELGVGRGQAQYLASLFHPDGPNDLAPLGFDAPDPPAGLPDSPLPIEPSPTGFALLS